MTDGDFELFKTSLANGIETHFPLDDSRFSVITFATQTVLQIPLSYGPQNLWAEAILDMSRIYGATNAEKALETVRLSFVFFFCTL